MANDRSDSRLKTVLFILFVIVIVFMSVDLLQDYDAGTRVGHVLIEATIMVVALIGASAIGWEWLAARAEVHALAADIEIAQREAERWRVEAQEILGGLGVAINQQFARWDLTQAEREIAMEVLKGSSLKEIAGGRKTSERTVREQSRAIYKKAGLSGRSALAGFFLGSMLLPTRTDS
jgi:DNA-binding CsgD family transcriptional regulator